MTASVRPLPPTLRDSLVRSGLVHREAHLQLVLAALQARVRELDYRDKPIPGPLHDAITGFESELAGVRGSLREGAPDELPRTSRKRSPGSGRRRGGRG